MDVERHGDGPFSEHRCAVALSLCHYFVSLFTFLRCLSGVSGLDLYQWTTNATWRWVGTTKTIHYPSASNVLASNLASAPTNGTMRRFRLHLPLYNAPVALHVGILGGHTIVADTAEYKHLPVVAYGTSILQGGGKAEGVAQQDTKCNLSHIDSRPTFMFSGLPTGPSMDQHGCSQPWIGCVQLWIFRT